MKDNLLKEDVPHIIKNRPYSIHYTNVPKGQELVLYQHWHDEIELLYLEDGQALFIIEDCEIHLSKGEALLIPPNLLHMAKRTDNAECSFFALVFNPVLFAGANANSLYNRFVRPVVQNGLKYVMRFTKDVPWQFEIISWLEKIFSRYGQDIELWEMEFHGILYLMWHEIYANHISGIEIPHNYHRLTKKLSDSIDLIHSGYSDGLTLEQLAVKSNLCVSVFCRYFKQLTGFTPFSYLMRYKIMKSCDLLIQSDKKIIEIAELCGFNNISNYNREFLRYVKTTPSAYRNQYIV